MNISNIIKIVKAVFEKIAILHFVDRLKGPLYLALEYSYFPNIAL
jgi:hypothetical protein